jgi:acetyl esterase/lipase
MYLYGSGFQAPISVYHWGFTAYLADHLNADVAVVPYPLAPTNHGLEVPLLVCVALAG